MGTPIKDDRRIEEIAESRSIRYANCWEDADILCEALRPRPGTRILSIGSAGDNSLSLLAEGAEVVAADVSLPQLAAIDLRKSAFATLDHKEVLRFLGIGAAKDRLQTFQKIKRLLAPSSRSYWESNAKQIEAGVIHAGKLERYFRSFRRFVLPLIHYRRHTDALLAEKDGASRRSFYDSVWNTWRWRTLFRLFFSRGVMERLGRDKTFFCFADGPIAERVLQRTEHALRQLPTHSNPYLEYIVTGSFQRALPRYLEPERFEAIRSGLDRLTLVHRSIDAAGFEYQQDGFDGFNLSNIFEYLSPKLASQTYENLLAVAKPGARLAYWNTFVPRGIPDHLQSEVRHLSELSSQLFQRDRAFFYQRFLVDEVDRISTVPD